MRFYVRSVSMESNIGGSRRGFFAQSVPSTPSISMELVPITGKVSFEEIQRLTRLTIVDLTTPEDLIITAEQLQATMSDPKVPKKEKEQKLRFRG